MYWLTSTRDSFARNVQSKRRGEVLMPADDSYKKNKAGKPPKTYLTMNPKPETLSPKL